MKHPHSPRARIGDTLCVGFSFLLALACQSNPAQQGPASTSEGHMPTGSGPDKPSSLGLEGDFGPGGSCDIQALMAQPANGCSNAGCHGARFQSVDLASPGVEQRLFDVASRSKACDGELLVDPTDPDNSLLLRAIDPVRFRSAPCGVMMPFGNADGVSAPTLECFEGWVKSMVQRGSSPPGEIAVPFEPVGPESYVNKVKTLLIGSAANSAEVAKVQQNPAALRDLIAGWLDNPEFDKKAADFLRVALQQKLVGSLDTQFMRLRGPRVAALRANLQESFVRTAVAIVKEDQPFSQVLTTTRWAVTTATLASLAFLERTALELKAEKHKIFRDPSPDFPTPPVSAAYSVENRVWHLPSWPVTCETGATLNAEMLFELMLGYLNCKQGAAIVLDAALTLTDADFNDWRFVDIVDPAAAAPPLFYDLDALRGAQTIALHQPRMGFFTTPAFLANWETNEDNQFRVTASQAMIVALGKLFSPADATRPVRLDGLATEHSQPGTACYGCHQFLDPMREYFAQGFSYTYQRPEEPGAVTPSFAFQGYTHDGGDLSDFARTLADHPDFAGAWAQKLCYWANSQACSEKDPEFKRIAQVFADSGFRFKTLLVELLSSPLVTGAAVSETARTSEPFVSITRKQHLCQLLDARLGVPDNCRVAANFAGLVPEDEFSRGSAEPVQTAVTGLFHYAAAEKLCTRLASKLVGKPPFPAKAPEEALDALVAKLMGLDAGNPRHDAVRASLGEHYRAAKARASTTVALQSAFIVACVSPEVQALGL